jgi:ribosomal protein S18 acetylase RimI-like enzyme
MIDHEFSTYFMFPDDLRENVYWFEELQCSISGKPVDAEKYQFMPNAVERKLMEKSAVVLHKNLAYIREHFPEVTLDFLNRLSKFEEDLKNHMDAFFLKKAEGYPDTANSNAWLIGRARYKDKNEEAALEYEEKYQQAYKKIDFDTVSRVALAEIQMVISQMKRELNKYEFRSIRPEEADQAVAIEQICFPPNEACSEQHMKERIATAPELFLVAVDKATGRLAGFLNGLSTDENIFRDEFFTDANLYNPAGKNVMLLGLDVLPAYRRQGIAKELVYSYARRERENGRQMLILTCLKAKVEMYEKMGFTDKGIADSTWGGEEWHEMSCRIDS